MQFNRKAFIFNYDIDFSKGENENTLHSFNNSRRKLDIYCVSNDDKQKLFNIRNDLFLIVKNNSAEFTVSINWQIPSFYIKVQGTKLEFKTSDLKNRLINIIKNSKSVKLQTKPNGKFLLEVEINIFTELQKNESALLK